MAASGVPGARYVLGFDFGTSGVKAALYDRQWTRVAGRQAPYPLDIPRPGWAQQDPAHWWEAMGQTSRAVMADAGIAPAQVEAIALATQMCGCVATDAAGEPLHPCLIWLDTRSQAQARRLTAGGPRVAGYGAIALARWLWLANGAPNLSGKDPTSKMAWLLEQPGLSGRVAHFLDVKDWLMLRATGQAVTSEDAAHLTWMMDTRDGRRDWSQPLMRRVGVRREQLPRILASCDGAGTLGAGAAAHLGLAAGTPVAAGSGDMNAYALGCGAAPDGGWHLHVGTSSWLGAQSTRRRVDPFTGIATLCSALPGHHLLVATQDSAGSAVAWAAHALGFADGTDTLSASAEHVATTLAAFDAAAGRARQAAGGALFLPWLHGERVPVDDAAARGGFVGIGPTTSRDDLALAALTGVALNTRWAWDHARKLVTRVSGPLRMLGGGARSTVWPQVFADVLRHPVAVVADAPWGGARGAAIMAAVACGWHADATAAMAQVAIQRVHEPDPALHSWAQAQYERFTGYYRATRAWHSRWHGDAAA